MRVLALTALLAASLAHAQERQESPRRFLIDLKGGPFKPAIDDAFPAGQKPYQQVFSDRLMVMGELEIDVELFQKLGIISVGVAVSYAEIYARAFIKGATDSTRSEQGTGFHLLPIKLLLQYRFDYLLQKYNVPVVPYVKVGGVLAPWWVTNGREVEETDGVRGEGVKLGLAASAGLAITLDWLSPRMAKDLDGATGINHTYIFAEGWLQGMNLGAAPGSRALDLSSVHVLFGVGFEL